MTHPSGLSDDCAAWDATRKVGYSQVNKIKDKVNRRGPNGDDGNVGKAVPPTVHATSSEERSVTQCMLLRHNEVDLKGARNTPGLKRREREEHTRNNLERAERSNGKEIKRARLSGGEVRGGISPKNKQKHTSLPPADDRIPAEFTNREFTFKHAGIRGGPEYIESDVEEMRRWILLSAALFYTWPHHDAAGLLTWTLLLTGMKLWSYVVPKNPANDEETASRQYIELVEAMNHISVDTENRLPEIATAHNFFLAPNATL